MEIDTPRRTQGESLRRTRSEGDIPHPRPGMIVHVQALRYSTGHPHSVRRASSSRTVIFEEDNRDVELPLSHRATTSTSRRLWSPPPPVLEFADIDMDPDVAAAHPVGDTPPSQSPRNLSRFGRMLAFLGYGSGASANRRALMSFVWDLGLGLVQVVAIITALIIAFWKRSPTTPHLNEWQACSTPLGAWSIVWAIRVVFGVALSYWSFVRSHKIRGTDDVETSSGPTPGNSSMSEGRDQNQHSHAPTSRGARTTNQSTHASPNTSADDPPLPYTHLYTPLILLSQLLTVAWFIPAHIFEYKTIHTCRFSSPHLWWLTFAILCIMYIVVLEAVVVVLVIFVVAPILLVAWNILLICLGRHPLQDSSTIRPDIGKLPKAVVDRIPLVIYIPPPPDEPNNGPIAVPEPVYAYPPKPPAKRPRRRFAFLTRLARKGPRNAGGGKVPGQDEEKVVDAPKKWEDYWEPSEYPFVRLEGNRAACAICLMDFEKPRRVAGAPSLHEKVVDGSVESGAVRDEGGDAADADVAAAAAGSVQEIPVETQTDEETEAQLKLIDAGEGSQPLRLLSCGHVFHQTCLDPWLTDVSGRCPVCQRPVEVPEPSRRKKMTGRSQPPRL